MKISKRQKGLIRKHYKNSNLSELEDLTGLSQNEIKEYLKKKRLYKKRLKPIQKIDYTREQISSFSQILRFLKENKSTLLLFIVFAIALYVNSLRGEFVSDDIATIVNNETVHDPLLAIQTGDLNKIINSFIYYSFGLNVVPYHMYSIILHIVNVILVFVIVSMLFNKRIAIMTALLFCAHPLNTEVVSWISGRKYSTISIGILLSSITYLMYLESKKQKYLMYSAGILATWFALFRYPWLIVTPAIIYVIENFLYLKKPNIKNVTKVLPHITIVCFAITIYIWDRFQNRILEIQNTSGLLEGSEVGRYTTLSISIFKAIWLLMFPNELTIYHEGDIIGKYQYYLIIITVPALLVLLAYLFKRKLYEITGIILIMIISLSPVLSPIKVSWSIAERYHYIATVGFSLLVALLLIKIEKKSNSRNITIGILITILGLYSYKTIIRNQDWSSRKSLWEATARVSPRSPRVHNNLGDVYGEMGDEALAEASFLTAIQLNPNYAEAMHNLGNVYIRTNRLDEAYNVLLKSYELKPQIYQIPFKLALVEYKRENYEQAMEYVDKSLLLNTNYIPALDLKRDISKAFQQ